ncbi:c-type cytochrome [Ruegeria arenilitoris]|jgi:nitric oxide reductase subunit C|uniref:Nitric oxide reductase subunit C n=1 Tax=Ruegeria arenilitoris TaxID=1173585 RepID=A0A238KBU1_9RHOB|nr:cytochrome c [Ruegeria arenilitoris]MBY6084387.1 cytochrome c [Ruegeria arenilitoris]SMX40290.1 Nitric oxide reductase subunit C [Ruegeria arenilitoris]
MREVMTKSMARNIFYGGSLFFILIFLALSAHSHLYIVNSPNSAKLDESVIRGKHVWEKHACINCHSIMGEGAYFAPEVANVMTRWGVLDDPESAFESLKGWMEAQPTGIPGRRQMPQFNLSDEEIRDLANFLIWTDNIDAQDWPPNDAG